MDNNTQTLKALHLVPQEEQLTQGARLLKERLSHIPSWQERLQKDNGWWNTFHASRINL